MTQQPTQEIARFYLKQMLDLSEGFVKTVCQANGIALVPTCAAELRPMPVFESDSKASLLTLANARAATTITFPISSGAFLQAYWKRYRVDRRIRQDVAVLASNYCWARFYAAKELMHCLVDEDGYAASSTLASVNELIEDLAAGGIAVAGCAPATMVDELAYGVAMRYLVPQEWKPVLTQLHDQLTNAFPNSNSYLHIAQLIRVPEQVLKIRMRESDPPRV